MMQLPPLARLGDRVATGLIDVTHDPAALDSEGFWAVVADFEGRLTCARFRDVRPAAQHPVRAARWDGPGPGQWASSLDRDAYTAGVRRIREHIARGEVYQANLCRVLSAPMAAEADIEALADRLAARHHAPYAGLIRLPGLGLEVATASPELFLRREGRLIESGPIKGTGRTEADLLEKDHAENVMIVDLVRNDLGRVCATGSVTVPDLCAVERHPGLVHLVSKVRGSCGTEQDGPNCWRRPSRRDPSRAPRRRAPSASSPPWRPCPVGRTAAASAGSTPIAAPVNWPSVSARSGSTGPGSASTSAPERASPGARIPNGSGRKPS